MISFQQVIQILFACYLNPFSVHLSLNLLSAAYEGVELGIGDHILMKAIAQATGRSVDKLKKQMEEVGDLGSIAENSKECSRFLLAPSPDLDKICFYFSSRS